MAIATNTRTTYSAVGIREDLSNIIYNITPHPPIKIQGFLCVGRRLERARPPFTGSGEDLGG